MPFKNEFVAERSFIPLLNMSGSLVGVNKAFALTIRAIHPRSLASKVRESACLFVPPSAASAPLFHPFSSPRSIQ
jgi:hypothetical protein